MKYTLAFYFVLLAGLMFGQENKILLEFCSQYDSAEETVLPYSKTVYQYNEQNQEELKEFYTWDKTNRNYHLRVKTTSEYNSGRLFSRRTEAYYSTNNTISSSTTSEYTYLTNGQPDSTVTTYFINESDPVDRKVFYYDSADESRYDSITVYYWSTSDPRWQYSYKLVYEYLDQRINIDRLWFDGTRWRLAGSYEEDYDEQGNKIREWTNYSDIGGEEETRTTYDEHNNKISSQFWRKALVDDPFVLSIDSKFENSYDLDGKLIKTTRLYTAYYENDGDLFYQSPGEETYYSYYCDGLLARITYGNSEEINPEKTYYYQKGTECEPEEVNTKSIAYPIPFNSFITVESELFTSLNATIDLLDVSGRLLLSRSVSSRITSYQLEVPQLPGGIYLLRIRSNEHAAVLKIIKA